MSDDAGSTQPALEGDLLRRNQEAMVAKNEADALAAAAAARKAGTDADTSAQTAAQARVSSLIPNLSGTNLNAIDDKTTDVAFSGIVTYSALANAGATVAERVGAKLGTLEDGQSHRILVTSQSDLLSQDLAYQLLLDALRDVKSFAKQTKDQTELETEQTRAPADPASAGASGNEPGQDTEPEPEEGDPADPGALRMQLVAPQLVAAATGALALTAGAAAPLALAVGGAAASAIPSLISLFSTTTTIKDHTEDISDLAAATAVIAGLTEIAGVVVNHDDFRLVPQPPEDETSRLTAQLHALARLRNDLVIRTMKVQEQKNAVDLEIAQITAAWDAAKKKADDDAKAANTEPDEPPAPDTLAIADESSANFAAALALLNAAVGNIDAFTTASQACAPGAKPPVAVALLAEALRLGWYDFVLVVKSLGGQSQEAVQDRHIRADSYTVLADASVQYMLLSLPDKAVVAAGVTTGVGSAHGKVGELPSVRVAPLASSSVASTEGGTPGTEHRHHWWPPHLPIPD